MSWLQDHLDYFVRPQLEGSEYEEVEKIEPLGYFKPEELTIIKNQWRSVKKAARGKTILLAGRDVFIFEILAQREGYPTVFMPECSRQTVHVIAKDIDTNLFLFDTGFAGSIPKGLGIKDFKLMSFQGNAYNGLFPKIHNREKTDTKTQVFPRLTFSRGLALRIEQTPKYWESGRIVSFIDGQKILQPMSYADEFFKAARLTVEIYTNSAAKFVDEHMPLKRSTSMMW